MQGAGGVGQKSPGARSYLGLRETMSGFLVCGGVICRYSRAKHGPAIAEAKRRNGIPRAMGRPGTDANISKLDRKTQR